MREKLPLKHIEEPEKFVKQGGESETFTFKPEKDKEYFYKEIRNIRRHPGKTLEEKAVGMKIVYDALKEHYGDKITDTNIIIAKNKENKPCIMRIQEKAKGETLSDLTTTEGPRYDKRGQQIIEIKASPRYNKAEQQLGEVIEDIPKVADKIMENRRFVDIVRQYPDFKERDDLTNLAQGSIYHITDITNTIVDKEGNITIVDW